MKYRKPQRSWGRPRNYSDPAYTAMRRAVRDRDGHKCRFPGCGSTKKLQVHHILPHSRFPMLRNRISNGITLCKAHHKMVTGKEMAYAQLFIRIISSG